MIISTAETIRDMKNMEVPIDRGHVELTLIRVS